MADETPIAGLNKREGDLRWHDLSILSLFDLARRVPTSSAGEVKAYTASTASSPSPVPAYSHVQGGIMFEDDFARPLARLQHDENPCVSPEAVAAAVQPQPVYNSFSASETSSSSPDMTSAKNKFGSIGSLQYGPVPEPCRRELLNGVLWHSRRATDPELASVPHCGPFDRSQYPQITVPPGTPDRDRSVPTASLERDGVRRLLEEIAQELAQEIAHDAVGTDASPATHNPVSDLKKGGRAVHQFILNPAAASFHYSPQPSPPPPPPPTPPAYRQDSSAISIASSVGSAIPTRPINEQLRRTTDLFGEKMMRDYLRNRPQQSEPYLPPRMQQGAPQAHNHADGVSNVSFGTGLYVHTADCLTRPPAWGTIATWHLPATESATGEPDINMRWHQPPAVTLGYHTGIPGWALGAQGACTPDGGRQCKRSTADLALYPDLVFEQQPPLVVSYRPKKILDYSPARGDWSKWIIIY